MLSEAVNFFLHIDKHLAELCQHYGAWTYAILFLIIFCETGLVVTPILPGDSLLFAAGALASRGYFNVHLLTALLALAAILGDTVNYWIGRYMGERVFHLQDGRFFKRKYFDKTHEFYERHGGKTIIIARFIPIIRTFAPFVAGAAEMSYPKFVSYNVIGALIWVPLFLYASYFFGNLPIVKNNFSLVVLAIIVLSVMPAVIEFIRIKLKKDLA